MPADDSADILARYNSNTPVIKKEEVDDNDDPHMIAFFVGRFFSS